MSMRMECFMRYGQVFGADVPYWTIYQPLQP